MKKMAADRRDSDPKAIGNIPEFKLSQVSSDVSDSQIGPAGDIGRKVSTHGYNKSEEAVNLDKNVEQYEDAQRFGVFQEGRETQVSFTHALRPCNNFSRPQRMAPAAPRGGSPARAQRRTGSGARSAHRCGLCN